ncbi:hypothetical protein [Novosphingobium mangrovi (ex Hu et al. 2023)]|uniref:Uncharacterized protein n=1 Tax=Novosphingobium mangrovi (ex Hu et al. 2023) TaxID=2930094 RepID=A0ABT0A9N0_9SPHN|nr:hypothetical protein [Novosphingobium mangrovi (ex Hu et al. 2023)]MCJ1959897.1 hypothetical protein [Novosphingobium mangrovi (ex Hu et al. 2023)]
MPGLVQSEEAEKFMSMMVLPHQLNISLGDPSKHDIETAASIRRAHGIVVDGIEKVSRLPDDASRTEAEKHHVARQIAQKTEKVLVATKGFIERRASALTESASADIDATFETKLERQAIHGELRAYVRDLAKKGETATIRDLMNESQEVASVVVHSPRILLGLNEKVHWNLREDAVKRYLPNAYANLQKSIELDGVAAKYGDVIQRMHRSLYRGVLADKYVRTRVEI